MLDGVFFAIESGNIQIGVYRNFRLFFLVHSPSVKPSTRPTNQLKASVNTEYGAPDVVEIKEIEKPVPSDNEVLVKIYATTVNAADSRLRGMNVPPGFKLISRLLFGITRPRNQVLGTEFAGEVVALGNKVTHFAVGDAVFGANDGAMGCHAEYAVVSETGVITKKPATLTFEEASAIPFGAHASLVFLRDFGKIKPGERVLINGASGALGVYAVQLAKYYGAEVTGVCSGKNFDLVRSLGADHVIDYTKEDFTQNGETYDIVYDTVGKVTYNGCKASLSENGRCLLAVAGIPDYFRMMWISITGGKKLVTGVAISKKKDLEFIKSRIEEGALQPVIDRHYPLADIAEAHRYVDAGHKRGSVTIIVDESFASVATA